MNSRIVRVGYIVAAWGILSCAIFLAAHYYLLASVAPGIPPTSYDARTNMVGWVGSSLVGAVLFGTLMVFRLHGRVRRRSLGYGIVYNTALFLALYTVAVFGSTMAIAFATDPEHSLGELLGIAGRVMVGPATLVGMSIWAFAVSMTQFMLQVADKFGPGQFGSLLLGRYIRPKQEVRIFMFLDLRSSTTIAERLGHSRYFEFIREFVADVTDPILQHNGEIYQYVGDETVVSWRPREVSGNGDCIRCYFAIEERIAELADKYQAQFGVTPQFKAGIHVGPVTAGEIGIVRRDVVYSGDVLNTTARIQGECNRYSQRLLVSRTLLDTVRLDPGILANSLGEIELRGREERVEVHAVLRGESIESRPAPN